MRFINDPEKCAAVLDRNGLSDITNTMVRLFCSNGLRIDLAAIEGDFCYYIGTPPRKTQKVIWREHEEIR